MPLEWFFLQAWRWKCGLPEEPFPAPRGLPPLETLQQSEFNHRFVEYMQSRLIMGAFRYGLLDSHKSPGYDRIGAIHRKLGSYQETGNTEALVDVANYALLEFTFPQHPAAHFRAMDDRVH